MEVYRISRTKWAGDLSGEGARRYGGRWNNKGTPCLYTAASRSLAVLEYSVNVSMDDIPRALSMVTLQVPDDDIHTIPVNELPGDWNAVPAPSSAKAFGTALLQSGLYGIIRVPSTVIPQEFNYLINPLHGLIRKCRILSVGDFIYDLRIKKA